MNARKSLFTYLRREGDGNHGFDEALANIQTIKTFDGAKDGGWLSAVQSDG